MKKEKVVKKRFDVNYFSMDDVLDFVKAKKKKQKSKKKEKSK